MMPMDARPPHHVSGRATLARIPEVIAAYDAAWNAPHPSARRRLLERSFAEDGVLIEPRGRFAGREAVLERIAGFSERFPGARVILTSGVDEHHGCARYAWAIVGADGSTLLEGLDVAEQGRQGLLRRVIMFFGPLPAKP
jgi:hypothetical protein